jgi:hypothetical protein
MIKHIKKDLFEYVAELISNTTDQGDKIIVRVTFNFTQKPKLDFIPIAYDIETFGYTNNKPINLTPYLPKKPSWENDLEELVGRQTWNEYILEIVAPEIQSIAETAGRQFTFLEVK